MRAPRQCSAFTGCQPATLGVPLLPLGLGVPLATSVFFFGENYFLIAAEFTIFSIYTQFKASHTFAVLCNCHRYLIPEHSHHPEKGTPHPVVCSHSQFLSPHPGSHRLFSVPEHRLMLDASYTGVFQAEVSCVWLPSLRLALSGLSVWHRVPGSPKLRRYIVRMFPLQPQRAPASWGSSAPTALLGQAEPREWKSPRLPRKRRLGGMVTLAHLSQGLRSEESTPGQGEYWVPRNVPRNIGSSLLLSARHRPEKKKT